MTYSRQEISKLSSRKMTDDRKYCQTCGRIMNYQKRWAKNWATVSYCSQKCRKEKPNKQDMIIEETILETLQRNKRLTDQMLLESLELNKYSNLRERIRRAARRLHNSGKLTIYQKGKRVDPSTAKGELELGLRR